MKVLVGVDDQHSGAEFGSPQGSDEPAARTSDDEIEIRAFHTASSMLFR